jgi:hypothetical protein
MKRYLAKAKVFDVINMINTTDDFVVIRDSDTNLICKMTKEFFEANYTLSEEEEDNANQEEEV